MLITEYNQVQAFHFYRYEGNKDNSHLEGTDTDAAGSYFVKYYKGRIGCVVEKYEDDDGNCIEVLFSDPFTHKQVTLRFTYNSPYTIIVEPRFRTLDKNLILVNYINKHRNKKNFKKVIYLNPHPFNLLSCELIKRIYSFI